MKWCAEHEDLSLLPHLSGVEKEALRRGGITTIEALASLKEFAPGDAGKKGDLVPASGQLPLIRQLAATWPVGPRLDELVHRARSFRRHVRKDDTAALSYIPGKGSSSLPVSTPDLNPNLVRVYIDAQHDYLNDRIYLLGGLVVACQGGVPDPERRRAVVRMTDGPPLDASRERQLLIDWTRDLLGAVVELTAPGTDEVEQEDRPDPPDLLQPLRAADAPGGPGPQLPAADRGHPAALRLPHPARRLRLADRHLPRRGGQGVQELPDDLPVAPVARRLPQVRLERPPSLPGPVQGPAVRLPRQAGDRRTGRVVHPPLPVQQPDPPGVRLRRLGPASHAEAGQGRRVRRLPPDDRGFAAVLPRASAGGAGARRRRLRRQPVHPEDALRPARPGELRGQGTRPGPCPPRVRHDRATRRAGRLEAHPARPARAAGADGRDPAGPLLRGGPGSRGRRPGPGAPAATPPAPGIRGGVPGGPSGRHAGPAAQGTGQGMQVVAGGGRGCDSGWRRRGSIATCTTPWH